MNLTKQMIHKNNRGQALVEYILILAFLSVIGSRFVSGVGNSLSSKMGTLAHVLSVNLSVGVCKSECNFSGYKNGYKSE